MYRCQVCDKPSEPSQPQMRYPIMRLVGEDSMVMRVGDLDGVLRSKSITTPVRTEIASEILCCGKCHGLLVKGAPLYLLRQQRGELKRVLPTRGIQPPLVTALNGTKQGKTRVEIKQPLVLSGTKTRAICEVCSGKVALNRATNRTLLCSGCARLRKNMLTR